jgi:hypothetical protein
MGRLGDFYKKAESDEALKAALKEANKKATEENISGLIKIASKFGLTLEREDFDTLDEEDLKAVAGGWRMEGQVYRCGGSCSTS